MAAGVAGSVAGEVAREAVETALVERLDRSATHGSTMSGNGITSRQVDAAGSVQRAVGGEGSASGGPVDIEAQKDELLRFTMSDEFEERLLEFLEDRLLGEIERRGGRYGGWFA